MRSKFRFIGCLLIAILPSKVKILILRMLGAEIGAGCYIGLSLINAKSIKIGSNVRIGHLNLVHRLTILQLESGSKIESLNWITGANKGGLLLGRNSSIRRKHFFDASGTVKIGANTIIAGRESLFFSHGQSPDCLDDVRTIEIGDWCYVGAATRFVPGTKINDHIFVAMGSVIVKQHAENYVVIGGSPGRVLKSIPTDAKYFQRDHLRHSHHTENYLQNE